MIKKLGLVSVVSLLSFNVSAHTVVCAGINPSVYGVGSWSVSTVHMSYANNYISNCFAQGGSPTLIMGNGGSGNNLDPDPEHEF